MRRTISRWVCVLILASGRSLTIAQTAPPQLPPVENVGGVSLPSVPRTVTAAAVQAGETAREELVESTPANTIGSEESNLTLSVAPGTTELVRIARNYLNRIITPFDDPKLLTVNAVDVRKEGTSLYLSTASDKPVGVYILSNDPADSRSISLTLIPARIPPKTIELNWGPAFEAKALPASVSRAKRWEEASSYEDKLLELVEMAARGEVPDGYSLSVPEHPLPCFLPGVEFYTGQRLTGSLFSLFVLRATNTRQETIELLNHSGCNIPGVALVAPWPKAYLEPKAVTEIYVAVVNDVFQPQPRGQLRPSLLER